jgi:stage II sporulation protein D
VIRAAIALLLAVAACPAATVRVRTASAGTVELPLERYVAGVLAGESSVFHSDAALKAMAVAARTYTVRMRGRHSAEGYDFCTTTHCQRLEVDQITAKLTAVATATAGELLWFEGKPAFTPYSRDCGGRTESAAAVWPDMAAPYLMAHDDPHCRRAGVSDWQWSGDPRRVVEALAAAGLQAPSAIENARVEQRTPSGRAATVVFSGRGGTVRVSASSLRFAIGRAITWNAVLSDWFDLRSSGGRLVFQGHGSGHGVGLCQRGADAMGIDGRSYREILAFYYAGATVGTTARGIAWQQICGATACLKSVDPAQDRAVLALAERQIRAAAERTGWPAPAGLEFLVYPDLDSFRNATGEPGWVAAHTVGKRVHLQPAAILRSRDSLDATIRHEVLHMFVESQAAPDLPLWFREGLPLFLEAPGRSGGPVHVPTDAELRRLDNPDRARRAYEDARTATTWLVARYGEPAVLDWVKRGIPAEVRNTVASQAPTNRK